MTPVIRSGAAALWLLAAGTSQAQFTPTLQIPYANAGTSAPLVASCLSGGYDGADQRGCVDAGNAVPATAASVIGGDGHAVFPGHGIDTQGQAQAAFGTLRARATTVDTAVDAFYNTQSRAASRMTDFIVASNGAGAAATAYGYTVTVHGNLSAPVGSFGTFPYGFGSVFVGFDVASALFCPSCDSVVKNWSAESGQAADTVLTGSFTLPAGTVFRLQSDLDVSSYANVFAGQSASVSADYASTVTVSLQPLTGGANTVGISGHDYAVSAVPQPPSALLMLLGAATVLVMRRPAAGRPAAKIV